ncbi:MAG TPA: NAD(P)-dependent oxidoreductase [Burkholderiales bacterium]|jgi:3-hydroxyisobutyrate dehydrogenase-like beta-hydroxyacid dehydrogenase
MKSAPIGVIGLGIMGSAIAANLARAGHRVFGYDLAPAPRAALKKAGGTPCASVAEVARSAHVILTSLPSAEALHAVAKDLKGRCVVVETSTLPIDDKLRARDALRKNGGTLLDCPLSGTGAQAKVKDLVVLASGDEKSFKEIEPFLKGFSRSHYFLGEFGNGSKMKFVANLLVAIHNVSAAEAFALGAKSGLSQEMIFKVISDGAGASRMFQVRGPQMVAGDYSDATMKVEVWQKDMKIIGEYAAKLGVATPLFNASGAIYNAAMAQGFAKQDTAAVCAVLERLAGIKRGKKHG